MADVLAHILVLCRVAEQDSVEVAVEYENCLVGTLSTFSGQSRQFNTRDFLTCIVPQGLKDAREAVAPLAPRGSGSAEVAPSTMAAPVVKQRGGRGPAAAVPSRAGGKPSASASSQEPLKKQICLFHHLKLNKTCSRGQSCMFRHVDTRDPAQLRRWQEERDADPCTATRPYSARR